ncbi:MAG: hypothetical protein JO316_25990 [Abitibacteriaceae bacterium]|nr:hypothetical protein [Abditibacteriaceae bacterium]
MSSMCLFLSGILLYILQQRKLRELKAVAKVAALGALMAATLGGAVSRAAYAVPIQITYTDGAGEGFNDPTLGSARRNAFEAAASNWSQRLPGTIPVVISASMDPLPGGANSAVLGSAGPSTFFVNASGLPLTNVFYPVALANQYAKQDLNQGNPEIIAQFNSNVDTPNVLGPTSFYYGTDGHPPPGDIDFYSVILHEFGHGLGFIDSVNQDGSFALNGNPDIYDTFLANGPALGATRLTALSQSARAAAVVSNALFFAGPNANAANGGSNARIYAPNPYEPGSSVGHLDEATYHGINELMTPISSGVTHDPGPVAMGVFHDIGWGNGGGGGTTPTPTPTPPPTNRPPNDNFANAQALSGNVGRVSGTNLNATKESGEPNHASNAGGKSVWYRWTAPSNGSVTFSTLGSNFDTLLAVYTGSSVSALKPAAANSSNNNVSSANKTSSVSFATAAGTVYQIAVDGFNSGTNPTNAASGGITLNWNFAGNTAVPPNDNFAKAQVVSGKAGKVTGTNVNATKEAGEPKHANSPGGKSVWYRWTAPASGKATFATVGSNFDTVMAVYTGTSVSALTLIGNNDDALGGQTSSVTVNVVAGKTYNIAVDGFNSTAIPTNAASGSIVFTWSFTAGAALVARTGPASPVKLSTASVEAATGLVHLRFSGALDRAIASDVSSYSVFINGAEVPVESAAYLSNSNSVTLALPEGAVHFGDKVVVSWNLTDSTGLTLVGQTVLLAH